jgi:hypothetical protein
MIELLAAFAIGGFMGFLVAVLHLENRIETYEARLLEERARADRAVDRLVTQIAGAAPIAAEAVAVHERAQAVAAAESHELANLFADEIGDDDEQQFIPMMPERDPRGRVRARA